MQQISYCCGGLTHMFIAKEVSKQLPNKELAQLIKNNYDAYLVGSYYPDSGYLKNTGYGEDSHWDSFLYTFADYIKKNPKLLKTRPKLIAFLFGCATHRVADEIFHKYFLLHIAEHDSNHNHDRAHRYGDLGLDLLINIDKKQWINYPKIWWVPVRDLVNVYQMMGKPEYTADKIIYGNSIIYFAGIGERLFSVVAYPYWRWKMAWTAKHYMSLPDCGLYAIEKQVIDYQMNLWAYLHNEAEKPLFTTPVPYHSSQAVERMVAVALVNKKLKISNIPNNQEGSIEMQSSNSLADISDSIKDAWR